MRWCKRNDMIHTYGSVSNNPCCHYTTCPAHWAYFSPQKQWTDHITKEACLPLHNQNTKRQQLEIYTAKEKEPADGVDKDGEEGHTRVNGRAFTQWKAPVLCCVCSLTRMCFLLPSGLEMVQLWFLLFQPGVLLCLF